MECATICHSTCSIKDNSHGAEFQDHLNSANTHSGNTTGISKIDWDKFHTNCITMGHID